MPAQYYRDPEDLENYLENSNWLADINNERDVKNESYREHLGSLEKFWLYKFSEDVTVVQKESEWFDEVVEKDDNKTTIKLTDRSLYKEDWIGLRELDEKGALDFRIAEGPHMKITDEDLFDVFEMMYGKQDTAKVDL